MHGPVRWNGKYRVPRKSAGTRLALGSADALADAKDA
jgi:hypothetical protein